MRKEGLQPLSVGREAESLTASGNTCCGGGGTASVAEASHKRGRETKSLESKMCHILANDSEIGVRVEFDK